jgi:thiopurine S-methyltransferase
MDPTFWAKRWAEGRIGFHEGRPNHYLQAHARRLAAKGRVLVPLCGKAEDLAYLAHLGHEVVGVEVVEDAVRAFFEEHELTPTRTPAGSGLIVYSAPTAGITIVAGDFFACSPELLGPPARPLTAFYDRAALIALPPDIRVRYVSHLRSLLPPRTPGLVVTIEYAPGMDPPPFSVGEDEVRRLFAGHTVELLEQGPTTNARFQEAKVDAVEKCFGLLG